MCHLLAFTCPKCENAFKVEAGTDRPGATCWIECPWCHTATLVRVDAGAAGPKSLPWAVRAPVVADA